MTNKHQKYNIVDLPHLVLWNIFMNLDPISLLECHLVCHRWQKVIEHSYYLRRYLATCDRRWGNSSKLYQNYENDKIKAFDGFGSHAQIVFDKVEKSENKHRSIAELFEMEVARRSEDIPYNQNDLPEPIKLENKLNHEEIETLFSKMLVNRQLDELRELAINQSDNRRSKQSDNQRSFFSSITQTIFGMW